MKPPTVRISSLGDLIAVLPYHLGFTPQRSLVVVGLCGVQLTVTARVDLGAEHEEGLVSLHHLCDSLQRGGAHTLIALVFEDHEGEGEAMAEAFTEVAQTFAHHLSELVYVRDGRWFPQWVASRRERTLGLPVPLPAEVPAVASYVGLGAAPLASRADVAALVQAGPTTARVRALVDDHLVRDYGTYWRQLEERSEQEHLQALTALGSRTPGGPDAVFAHLVDLQQSQGKALREFDPHAGRAGGLWRRVMAASEAGSVPAWSDDEVVRLAASLIDSDWRDGVVSWLTPGSLGIEVFSAATQKAMTRHLPSHQADSPVLLERLTGLVARLPDDGGYLTAGLCTVLASFAWHHGHGVIASSAIERALMAEPDYRLARLVGALIAAGVRPPAFEGRDGDEEDPAISV